MVPIITIPIDELLSDWSQDWSRLAGSCPRSAVFLDPIGISAVCRSSLVPAISACMAVEDGRAVALALVSEGKISMGGVALNCLQSINVDMFGRYEFLHEPGHDAAVEKLWEYILASGRWDAVHLHLMPGECSSLAVGRAVAERLRWYTHTEQQFSSPWRALPRQVSEWGDGLKSKFKSNLRNREGRIGKLGKIRFEVVAEKERLRQPLEAFYQLELASWKGKEESAIVQKPRIRSFYDHLMLEGAGSSRIAILYLDDTPIAAQLLRVMGGRIYVVKVSYDPELGKYSPGQLIMCRTIQYAIEAGVTHLDFLGEEATWKSDWDVIPDASMALKLYSPGVKGGYAYFVRHGIREALKKVPAARRLVNAIRTAGRRP